MCGRYVQVSSPTILAERFQVETVRVTEKEPDYNVTPRADVPVVAVSRGERTLDLVRWGLVPSWAKDLSIGDKLINARADTVASKPAYKRAFVKRRCIVPADGFYEWKELAAPAGTKKKVKQPYFIRRRDGEPLAFAGLWEIWHDPNVGDDAPRIRSCVIITTDANDVLAPIHNRMPVVLPESEWGRWLDPEFNDVDALQKLLVPAPSDEFEAWEVTTLVNKPANNGPELLERAHT
ncbi:MAG TPA: SOS response-associated peptidase [Acidimicrobiia bacterium]|nr:SOS response-associated peptidase [Acidimicrobiia bacterium]